MSTNFMDCLGEGIKWACTEGTIDFIANKSPAASCSAFMGNLIGVTVGNYVAQRVGGQPGNENFDKQMKRIGVISSAFFTSLAIYSGIGGAGLALTATRSFAQRRALVSLISYAAGWKVVKNPDQIGKKD